MAIQIVDREIDAELEQLKQNLKRVGINASKTDVIRFLLNIKRQGKKTNKNWAKIL